MTDLHHETDNNFDEMEWAEEGTVRPVATKIATRPSITSLLWLGARVILLGGVVLNMTGKLIGPSEAETKVTHGRTAKSSGDVGAATTAFQAVVNTPDANEEWQAVAHYELARLTWERGEFTKAIPEITVVLAMPELPEEERLQSLMIRANASESVGNFDTMEEDCNAILATPDVEDSFRARALMYRGMVHSHRQDYEAALKDATSALGLARADNELAANILYNRGVYFGQLNRTAEEVADYTAVIQRGSSDSEILGSAYHNRGYMRGLEHRYDEAIADTKAELELNGASAAMQERARIQLTEFYCSKALQAAENEEYTEAIASETLGMEMAVDNITSLTQLQLNRATHYAQLGRTADAFADYNELLERGSTDHDTLAWGYHNRAEIHNEFDRTSDALTDLEAALKLSEIPDDTAAACLTGICAIHEDNQEYELALNRASDICNLTQLSPYRKSAGLYLRGFYQIQLGQSQKAARDLEQARVVATDANLEDMVKAIDALAPEVSLGPADRAAR